MTDIDKHVDVDSILENYAWRMFKDSLGFKKSGLETFKHLEREEAEFIIDRRRLALFHGDPDYKSMQLSGAKPNTIFKSVFTNNTSQPQAYSLKTERTSESIVGVVREQGFTIGAEAELTLKTPCEIAELKTGFKYETHFNNLNETTKSEILSWAVDSNIMVPPGAQTEAAIVIEELNYNGSYSLTSTLSGMVTIIIKRLKDGALVLPVTANIATIFQDSLTQNSKKFQHVVVEDRKVKIQSKGHCHFQFAMKQYIELKELKTPRDMSKEYQRMNLQGI
ncbi:unnamed protein product [Bursaphelenchus xylophilus]|uniref:(pine wood nematode) hypothetical protein n=1 Tax=Bursaphelenchus xylophilus TaxID=6326 RepID=A0A1I7S3A2_BURXY|nr:unnamed protein product [Bursaphelenchus xylophilus]CAG9116168.1 unnamed protein product [Bursaphelenchus xylophilus]